MGSVDLEDQLSKEMRANFSTYQQQINKDRDA